MKFERDGEKDNNFNVMEGKKRKKRIKTLKDHRELRKEIKSGHWN